MSEEKESELQRYERLWLKGLEEIKFLESRLKESNEIVCSLSDRLKEAESKDKCECGHHAVRVRYCKVCADAVDTTQDQMIESLEQRLSQAEAKLAAVATEEWDALKERLSQAEANLLSLNIYHENISLKERLSHLMDVGGNVVEALENYMGKFGDCGETYEIARRSLLNWQDFNNKQQRGSSQEGENNGRA